jgi:hypothetical protein
MLPGINLTDMRKSTQNKVRMYDAVRTILETNQAAWSENQMFEAGVTQFNALLEELKTVSFKHETSIAGIKEQRTIYMDDLIEKTMVLRNGLSVFAFETKKYAVSEKLDFSISKLRHASQLELRNRLTGIYELIMEHESEVVIYGITSEMVLAFMDVYEQFEDEIVALRKSTIERKLLTNRISFLEFEIKELFRNKLDVLIENKRSSNSTSPPSTGEKPEGESDIGIAS